MKSCNNSILICFQHLRTALHTAACDENDNTKIIALILKCEGVDVNTRDGVSSAMLFIACLLSQVYDKVLIFTYLVDKQRRESSNPAVESKSSGLSDMAFFAHCIRERENLFFIHF